MADADSRPVETISKSRPLMALLLVLSAAVMAEGHAYRLGLLAHEPSRRWPWSGESLGYFFLAGGILLGVAALSQLLLPSRLLLSPDGLVHETPWGRHTWRWSDISAFRIEEGPHRERLIRFDRIPPQPGQLASVLPPKTNEIPGGWTSGLDEVCARLNSARERWG